MFNALPLELKTKIINTVVLSGHGCNDSTNFTTIDKLYLLDAKEIYGTSFTSKNNTVKDQERQLDYYSTKNVSITNNSLVIKKRMNGNRGYFWLRSALKNNNTTFYYIDADGVCSESNANSSFIGISPAFRIAE